MDTKLQSFIKMLEKEITEQTWGMTQYLAEKNWNRANNQQWYLAGLNKALELVKAEVVKEAK